MSELAAKLQRCKRGRQHRERIVERLRKNERTQSIGQLQMFERLVEKVVHRIEMQLCERSRQNEIVQRRVESDAEVQRLKLRWQVEICKR